MGRDKQPKPPSSPARDKKPRPTRPPRSLDVGPEERKRTEDRQAYAMSLDSRFCPLPADLADYWRGHLVQELLPRPLLASAAALSMGMIDGLTTLPPLSCPRRPKWHRTNSKIMVEHSEEAYFRRWLVDLDEALAGDGMGEPTFVERNLDVWRQLWRVGEASDILCVLADIRIPLLHLPASLLAYLRAVKPARPVLLVLTKCDLVTEAVVRAWRDYFAGQCPDFRIVCIESYLDHDARRPTSGTRPDQRAAFINALRDIHVGLCTPHPNVAGNPERLAAWRPRVHAIVDWNNAMVTATGHPVPPAPSCDASSSARPYVSIALIGQPNVGKSSLLNALLGHKAVRASRTPGKTKHLQTYFWTSDVRLIDCPGLVCPSRVGLRRQVFAGIVPTQAAEAAVAHACSHLPLERILGFPLARTTDDLLVAYAQRASFITARAGRPDTSRAAAEILRSLHSGKIRWAFWPPTMAPVDCDQGIFLGGAASVKDEETASDNDADEDVYAPEGEATATLSVSHSGDDSEGEASGGSREDGVHVTNAFSLLAVADE